MMTKNEPMVGKIVVVANAAIQQANHLAEDVQEYLQNMGVSSSLVLNNLLPGEKGMELEEYALAIVLGGDGTMLRAGHACARAGIPMLGINAGRFGFLAELSAKNWQERIPLLFSGIYHLEERMMLKVSFESNGNAAGNWDVINELVVCRGQYVRPIQVIVETKDGLLSRYMADGVITATATGSTAYAMAAGGPILPPEMRNILLMPIAPHFSLDRGIILSEGISLSIRVHTSHEAVFSTDGLDSIPIHNEDRLVVESNSKSLKMIRFQAPSYFYNNLISYMENNPVFTLKNYE